MSEVYDPAVIEPAWSERWERQQTHKVDLHGAPRPYYNLMMFPYPSAEGLHVGNVFAFVGSDIHGRFMRAQGCNVFEPMGWDAFGMHSENYALKTGVHPAALVPRSIGHFRDGQLKRIGAMFDWSHQVNTTDPIYYRWTQWIFVRLFKAGLAYQKQAAVNWCPACRTVLADEQAEGGVCERCKTAVEPRNMLQWFFRITAYAQRLLDHLDQLDWSPITTAAQRHWIGRSDHEGRVEYHLRDWCVSRQRYWGTPIPIIHCPACGTVPVPEEQLPVLLPAMEQFGPDGSGHSPLARCEEFVRTVCPTCGGPASRETDVCDNFLDSSWFFLRYPSSDRADAPFDNDLTRRWLPVGMYIGGQEHAVLHLMYARFVTMALKDLGLIEFEEPFRRFRAHGLITRNGAKMSKSRPQDVINPDRYIDQWGADTFRCYLMFMGPYQGSADFRDEGIVGIRRFIERVWRYVTQTRFEAGPEPPAELSRLIHRSIRKVTQDIADLRYNTAIAALMELLNGLVNQDCHRPEHARVVIQLLSPFAPFISHELWERIGGPGLVVDAPWPAYAPDLAPDPCVEYGIQVNGRICCRLTLPATATQTEVEQAALADPAVRRRVGTHPVARVVYVAGRLLNIVCERTA
ncbi:MAG: class I tRNA ligase family protein [Phycisphaeraceae bacterium]|nr:class I tRNA ligase family protein [Phycisphaeraceae bacterium]